jgi:hypothetical protein
MELKYQLDHNTSFKKYFMSGLTAFLKKSQSSGQFIANEILARIFDSRGELSFFKSGRSALYAVLKALKEQGIENVFIPNRVCNLITKVAEQLNLSVHYYSLDKLQRFQQDTFKDLPQSVVIAVSIWGKEFNSKEYIQFIRSAFSLAPALILDECQNLYKSSSLDHSVLKENDSVIFSFNDKTIPGFMGGLAWNPSKKYASSSLSAKEELTMMLYYLSDLRNINKHKAGFRGEYSSCNGLRYGIDDKSMSRVSLAVNAAMIKHWSEIESQRMRNYQVLSQQNSLFKEQPANKLTPYIPIDTTVQLKGGIKLKGPYLKHPEETIAQAMADGGQVCAINSFRYKITSNEQRG